MKSYIWGVFWCFAASFLISTGWYVLFGYNQFKTISENLARSYSDSSFWLGVAIWTLLYAVFVAFPIIFVRQKPAQ